MHKGLMYLKWEILSVSIDGLNRSTQWHSLYEYYKNKLSGGSYTHYCHLEEQSRVPSELSHFTPCLDHSTPPQPKGALIGSTVVHATNTCTSLAVINNSFIH